MTRRIRIARTKRIEVSPEVVRMRQEHRQAKQAKAIARPGFPSTSQNRALLDSVYDAILITEETGSIIDVNPRAEEFLLYSGDELRGMNMVQVISGADSVLLSTIVENLKARRYALVSALCMRRDDSSFPAEIAISEISWEGQTSLVCSIRDLTVRKQAEKALKEALSRLEERERARSLLVSNVSHELRTPVTSIAYGISNLLKGVAGEVPDTIRTHLERFSRECRRLLTTANQILDLQTLESQTIKLAKVCIPLGRLVDRSSEALDLHAEHKGVELIVESTDGVGFVDCDPAKMERVLQNVISNAIKYTPGGGRVEVSIKRDEARYKVLRVDVSDTGVGIPAHALQNVMERYYRAGSHADGAGLGLAISKEIVELHGGSIEIVSPPAGQSQGTMVSVCLAEVDAAEALIVTNDDDTAGRISKHLEKAGYVSERCESVDDAIAKLTDAPPDLVVTDTLLPDGDGVQLVMRMRSDESVKTVPIMVAGVDEPDEAKKEILRALAIPVVSGDWREEEFLDTVEGILASGVGMDD